MLKRLTIITAVIFVLIATCAITSNAWASGTIKISGDEETFTAYRMFSGNVSGDKLSDARFDEQTAPATIWKDIAGQDFTGATTAIAWLKEAVEESPSAVANKIGKAFSENGQGTSFESGESVELEDGYYVITGSRNPIPILTVVGNGSSLDTIAKTPAPQVTKEADVSDVEEGDGIEYTITVTLPADYAEYDTYYFKLTDEAEGVNPLIESMEILLVDADGKETDVTEMFDSKAEGYEFTVETEDLKTAVPAAGFGDKFVISYYGILADGDFTTGAANPNTNTVALEYSSVPHTSQHATTPKKQAKVRTYRMHVVTVNEEGEVLEDAHYVIHDNKNKYWGGNGWNAEDTGNKYVLAVTPSNLLRTAQIEPLVMVSDVKGAFDISSIAANEYRLTEIQAPEGYIGAIPATITVTINEDKEGGVELLATCEDEGTTITSIDVAAGLVNVQVVNKRLTYNEPKNDSAPLGELLSNLPILGDIALPTIAVVIACAVAVIVIVRLRRKNRE